MLADMDREDLVREVVVFAVLVGATALVFGAWFVMLVKT